MKRSPLPALQVTPRDFDVLDALAQQRFLSIPQIAALFFPSRAAAQNRLRRLYQHRLVVQVFLPARPWSRTTQTIYGLGPAGARLLAPRYDGERPPYVSPSNRRSALFLDHTLRRNDLRICLLLLDQRRELELRLLSWRQGRPEVRFTTTLQTGRDPQEKVTHVPDGMFLLTHHRRTTAYAVEIDMGTVPVRRMRARYRAYYQWWKQGGPALQLGAVPFRVLTLTTTPTRLEALRRAAYRAPETSSRGSGLFWFALLEAADIAQPTRLLDRTWVDARAKTPTPQNLLGK